MDWLVYFAPQRWLIYLCEQAKRRDAVIGGFDEGNQVLQISDNVVVKYGYGVTPGEAATQNYAYQHLNRHFVRVPRVYRYFQVRSDPSWPMGYLFMEHIPGQTLEDLDPSSSDNLFGSLANAVSELGKVSGDGIPGPTGGGMLQGYLWGDNGARETFGSVEDMNRWLNKRLKLIDKAIDLRPYPLVLCHLDLCRRNIKLMGDNSICLLDWGHAGLFPRFFEVAAASCINDDATYGKGLLQAITKITRLTDAEQEGVNLLLKARAACLRYLFEPLAGTGMPADIESWGPPPPLNS